MYSGSDRRAQFNNQSPIMRIHPSIALFLTALLAAGPAVATDEKETGWSSTAEVGLVVTGGNSETETLSFKNETARAWEKSSLRLKAGAIRAETTTTTRSAVQAVPAGPILIDETVLKATNAEAYYFEIRYDKQIHEKLFWFAGTGWDKNEPAGIDSRKAAFAGVGNIWRKSAKIRFRTDYAVSYTDQEDVVSSVRSVGKFAGLRASWIYRHKLNKMTKYSNDLVLDYGLEESANWRADMINAVAATLNSRLALKVSLQHLYNNLPPIELLPVVDGAGMPVVPAVPDIEFELDELDTVFSTSLVINF